MKDSIKTSLLAFIVENFMVEEDDIDFDKSMIDEGIIDSFGLIEIAAFIEREFGLNVEEDQMKADNFHSFNAIVDFIDKEIKTNTAN